MTELKPCPICGQPAVRGKKNDRKWVGCQNFKCWIRGFFHEETWNEYRPVEDALKDEIRDLKFSIKIMEKAG